MIEMTTCEVTSLLKVLVDHENHIWLPFPFSAYATSNGLSGVWDCDEDGK